MDWAHMILEYTAISFATNVVFSYFIFIKARPVRRKTSYAEQWWDTGLILFVVGELNIRPYTTSKLSCLTVCWSTIRLRSLNLLHPFRFFIIITTQKNIRKDCTEEINLKEKRWFDLTQQKSIKLMKCFIMRLISNPFFLKLTKWTWIGSMACVWPVWKIHEPGIEPSRRTRFEEGQTALLQCRVT